MVFAAMFIGLALAAQDVVAQTEDKQPAAEETVDTVVRRRLSLEVISHDNVTRLEEIHNETVSLLQANWRPDSKEVVCTIAYTNPKAEGVEIRDGETFEVLGQTGAGRRIQSFVFNPVANQVAWVTQASRVEVLNMDSGEGFFIEDGTRLPQIVFSPDGKRLVIGGQAGAIKICNSENGETVHTLETAQGRLQIQPVLSRDGKWVAGATPRGALSIWNMETGEVRTKIERKDKPNVSLMGATFDTKGERLLLFLQGGMIQIWDAEKGELKEEKDASEQSPTGGRLLPESDVLLTVGPGVVAFWNSADLKLLHVFDAPASIQSLSISPDGKRIVVIGRNPPYRVSELIVLGVVQAK